MKKRQYYKGKRISKGEKEISQYLDKHNIEYIREKTFKDCVNFCGNSLRFDFYLEQFNLLIEYQGQHHEKPVNKYRRAKYVHEKTVVHDKIKEDFAESHQINLIKIYYQDYKNLNTILDEIFKEIDVLLEGD
jgi:very-short-patch-repair endonuclease